MMLGDPFLLVYDDPGVAALLAEALAVYHLPPRRAVFAASPAAATAFERIIDSETGMRGFVQAVYGEVDRAARPPAHKGAR